MDQYRDTYGVETICKVLQIAPSGYRRHAVQQLNPELRCVRSNIDETLLLQIHQVRQANMQVYGGGKAWHQLRRQGVAVARRAVERLMRRSGLKGIRRGKGARTTVGDAKGVCPLDRVNDQWFVQGAVDSSPSAFENQGIAGTGHA